MFKREHVIKIIKLWVSPFCIGALVFWSAKPLFAEAVNEDALLLERLASGNVTVGAESDGRHQMVYYSFEEKKYFVSPESVNSKHPALAGEYMVWEEALNSGEQVVLYHIPTKTKSYLTWTGMNIEPKVSSEGRAVWQSWLDDKWQIFFFDGAGARQITEGDVSLRPDVYGEEIIFSRRDSAGAWRAVKYNFKTKESEVIAEGLGAKRPKFKDKQAAFNEPPAAPVPVPAETAGGTSTSVSEEPEQQNTETVAPQKAAGFVVPYALRAKCDSLETCERFCTLNKYYDPCRLLWYQLETGLLDVMTAEMMGGQPAGAEAPPLTEEDIIEDIAIEDEAATEDENIAGTDLSEAGAESATSTEPEVIDIIADIVLETVTEDDILDELEGAPPVNNESENSPAATTPESALIEESEEDTESPAEIPAETPAASPDAGTATSTLPTEAETEAEETAEEAAEADSENSGDIEEPAPESGAGEDGSAASAPE